MWSRKIWTFFLSCKNFKDFLEIFSTHKCFYWCRFRLKLLMFLQDVFDSVNDWYPWQMTLAKVDLSLRVICKIICGSLLRVWIKPLHLWWQLKDDDEEVEDEEYPSINGLWWETKWTTSTFSLVIMYAFKLSVVTKLFGDWKVSHHEHLSLWHRNFMLNNIRYWLVTLIVNI